MFDKIVYMSDRGAHITLNDKTGVLINLMNLHLVFEDANKKVLGEVDDMDDKLVKVRFLGEIVNNKLIGGTIRKPSLDAKIRVIEQNEIPMITGLDTEGFMKLGVSPFYNDFPVFLDVNNFFSNHFSIFGNSGSGKSCGISRLFQNMFSDQRLYPYKANILLFDSSGEYYNAFRNLNEINSNYHYRFFCTNEKESNGERLRLPIYLLNADDLALLLQATNHSQLPIIERMLKLALVFSQNDMDANNYKNHLIAKAIMTILYTNETAPNKRNEIFSILASCSTKEFNLEAPVQGIGYTRKFRECFLIDNQGQFSESVLLTEYVSSFIKDDFDNYEPKGGVYYNLDTLEKALNFTLISEGWLRNDKTYGDAVTIKVRLHSLIVGDNAKFFDVPDYISLESYLSSLLISNGKKYQIVNFNLVDIDDDFAKVITKIYSRLVFEFAKSLKDRASIPFHIVVEEAHRYIQNDTDRFLIGYNIFERIAKEGRKYAVILGLISQRPVELSDTVISQCSNFLIFKMNHPVDVDYIRKMVPNISDEIVEKQKTLQAGTCLGFGMAFRIPLIVKMEMPSPSPLSSNCDVVGIWSGAGRRQNGPNNGFVERKVEPVKNPEPMVEKGIPELAGNKPSVIDVSRNDDFGTSKPVNVIMNSNIAELPKKEEFKTIKFPIVEEAPKKDNSVKTYSGIQLNSSEKKENLGFDNIGNSNTVSKNDSLISPITDSGIPLIDVNTSNESLLTDTGVPLVSLSGSSNGFNDNLPVSDAGVPLIDLVGETNVNNMNSNSVMTSTGQSLLELIDDDSDDSDDFGPDFS